MQVDGSLIPLPFNSKYKTGQTVSELWTLPADDCKVLSISGNLYALYDDDAALAVSLYNTSSHGWDRLDFDESLDYLTGSAYMATPDDPNAIYVFGGLNKTSNALSDQLVRVDLDSLTIATAASSLQPSSFYNAASVLINHNTMVLVGGQTQEGWVSLKQLAVWQYESWSFKAVSVDEADTINARIDALLLPVFSSDMITQEYLSSNYTDFSVESVLMVGGESSSGSNSTPNFARLDVTSSTWAWTSLDTSVSLANSKTNNQNDSQLSLSSVAGAAVVYDTLIVASALDGAANYTLTLYNTSSFEVLNEVDYSAIAKKSSSKSNKSLIIALSVVIPTLALMVLGLVAIFVYKKFRSREDEKQKEKDLKDIMEFYQAGNSSSTTFASHGGSPEIKESYFGDNVKVNNYDDGDNLSISSWKRKRWQLESDMVHQIDTDAIPPVSALKRSLSTLSTTLGRSLKRNFSYQSSIQSFFTAETSFEDPQPPSPMANIPVLKPVEASNSTLNLIPEEASLNSFYQKRADAHSMLSNSTVCEPSDHSASPPPSPPPAARTTSLVFHNRLPIYSTPVRSKDFLPPPESDLDNLDVQILVSSKRRSKLRITNPDPDGPRKRTVSNEKEEEQ
ncbi:hypothetical protein OGAPHI_006625 [Ogataea philodendri]|uniref:Galactose oxidase n=1 Tax=Ogataea philodendri TaxID=1378263 RepID=A0A9P8SZZ8_9ASCO|nr:uncharacterized protein OGAPHI_006625 [Ogataea philodendri]KAH3661218.1 hypothetical protein OGAPHI_006625 [Ogataea philodendri]